MKSSKKYCDLDLFIVLAVEMNMHDQPLEPVM